MRTKKRHSRLRALAENTSENPINFDANTSNKKSNDCSSISHDKFYPLFFFRNGLNSCNINFCSMRFKASKFNDSESNLHCCLQKNMFYLLKMNIALMFCHAECWFVISKLFDFFTSKVQNSKTNRNGYGGGKIVTNQTTSLQFTMKNALNSAKKISKVATKILRKEDK